MGRFGERRISRCGAAALAVLLLCADAAAQATVYHLHNEASSTPSAGQLKTAGPEVPIVVIQSIDLKNVSPTAVVIKTFDTQAGVPGATGTIASGATVTFTLWMKKTANRATMFPRGSLRLNNDTGTLLCTATGTGAVTTTLTKFVISCTTSSVVTITSTDRLWLSGGVNMTAGPGNQSVKAELHIEGTLNGNTDSMVSVPAIQPPPPPPPLLTDMAPAAGLAGASVTLTGTGFGATKGSSTVAFNGVTAATTAWSNTSITATVPAAAATGSVAVTTSAGTSNTLTFTVWSTGAIAGTISRATGGQAISGATVDVLQAGTLKATRTTPANGTYTVTGLTSGSYDVRVAAAGFATEMRAGVIVGSSTTTVNVALAVPGSITGTVKESDGVTPVAGAAVTVSSGAGEKSTTSNGSGAYTIGGLSPATYSAEASAPGFAPQVQGTIVVAEGTAASANFTLQSAAPSIVRYVYDEAGRLVAAVNPAGELARYAYDAAGNVTSIARASSIAPAILEFTPGRGPSGTSVTLTGTGFSSVPSSNTVTFNGTAASVVSSTTTSIVTTVPAGATTGRIAVTVGGVTAQSSEDFVPTSGTGAPTITGFSPSIGSPGTTVTVTGTNFSAVLGNNITFFNASRSGLNTATTTQIVTPVPMLGTSGHLSVATAFGKAVSAGDFFVPQSPYTPADVDLTGRLTLGTPFSVPYPNVTKVAMLVYDAAAGERVSFHFTNITDGSRAFSLRSPDATFLIPFQSGGVFVDSLIMPVAGTYTLSWLPGSTAGGRTVTAYNAPDVVLPVVPGGGAVPINPSIPGQNVRLTFAGTAGTRIAVRLTGVTIAQADVSILKPNGTALGASAFVDTSGGFLDAQLIPANGQYSVLVDPRAEKTGVADVTVLDATDATGTIAADGEPVLAATTIAGQNARLTFSGAAGQRVSLKITGSTFGTGCGSAYAIVTSTDVPLGGHSCVLPGFDAFIDPVTLPAAGTYTVLVDPQYIYTGSVTLRLYDVPADPAGTIAQGSPVTPIIEAPGQKARYTFTGTQGQRVSLQMTDGSINCVNVGIAPPGSSDPAVSVNACPNGFLEPYELPANGTYTVIVDPADFKTGSVTVAMFIVPADPSGPIVPGGDPVLVNISTAGQNARYTFTAGANQRVSLEVTSNSISCATVSIRNSSDGTVAATTACADAYIDLQTLASGSYSVFVNPSGAATGSMTLTLHDVPADYSTSATIGGGAVSVATTTPGQNAFVTVAGNGQVVNIAISGSSFGCTTLRLLRPDGSQQASGFACGATFTFQNQTLAAGTSKVTLDPSGKTVGGASVTVFIP